LTRSGRRQRTDSRPEAGYALLLAVFLAATMFMLAAIAAPSILNVGRRQREQELIWRGSQYVRGIRLYYQKNGRYPQNREELVKGTLGVHFVRKQFADPVASQGGDWRFIYVSPTGQLTGSVRYHSLQEMAAALGAGLSIGGAAAAPGAAGTSTTDASGTGGTTGQTGTGAGTGANPGGNTSTASANTQGQPGAQTAGATDPAAGNTGALGTTGLQPAGMGLTPVALQAVDGPVLGGSLVGVASKVKKDSLMVYQKKSNYFQWEFIWNPLLTQGAGGVQAGQLPGLGNGNTPAGAAAGGTSPGTAGFGGAQGGGIPGMAPIPGIGASGGPGGGGAGAGRR
jgi:hypothetical protein